MKHLCTLAILLTVLVLVGCEIEKPLEPPKPAEPDEPAGAPQPWRLPWVIQDEDGIVKSIEPAVIIEPEPDEEPDLTQITTDIKKKRIEIKGSFCMKEGILDFLGVTTTGRHYESILAMHCKGSLLHMALISIGAVPGPTPDNLAYLKKNPPEDGKVPDKSGTALDITVEWEKDGKTVSVPASFLLVRRKGDKVQTDGKWYFTGSYFVEDPETKKQYYMADVDLALVAVAGNASAASVINFGKDMGNPYAGPDSGFKVNTRRHPGVGTDAKVIITLAE